MPKLICASGVLTIERHFSYFWHFTTPVALPDDVLKGAPTAAERKPLHVRRAQHIRITVIAAEQPARRVILALCFLNCYQLTTVAYRRWILGTFSWA